VPVEETCISRRKVYEARLRIQSFGTPSNDAVVSPLCSGRSLNGRRMKRLLAAGRGITSWSEQQRERPARSDRTAAILGSALGLCFLVCFVTGLLSHTIQHPVSWFQWPARPAGLYRFTQGAHVATGIAAVPLLFAKLWSVFPRLFQWPFAQSALHAVERLMLLPLVGGSLFMLVTGVANIELWYPWVFFFPAGHYAVSFIVIGSLIIHMVAKFGVARQALAQEVARTEAAQTDAVSRRGFLGAVGATSIGLVAATIGQTVSPLRKIALLAPRRPDIGRQGFPVNKTAVEAGVTKALIDPGFTLTVIDGEASHLFTLQDLRAFPQHSADLPIACVEGWSANQKWTGVRLRDVLAAAGISSDVELGVESIQRGGRYRRSDLSAGLVADRDSLLAMKVNGEDLHPDHGYPLRLIAPNRPGVLQTKWVHRLEVL
jgi:DMSO/TMAO reductase YedYZ molybdopterin-dependent catalytic subunit